MNLPTIIIACIIAAVFIAIIASSIRSRRNGKGMCSCSGSCESCHGACYQIGDSSPPPIIDGYGEIYIKKASTAT